MRQDRCSYQAIALWGLLAVGTLLVSTGTEMAAVPKSVENRFVLSDPVWKEMVVRDDLVDDYASVWKNLVEILIDNGFEIGFMEKDSGYVRTNENAGLVRLKKYWVYDIKVIAKIVMDDDETKGVSKVRLQVLGHIYKIKKGSIRESYSGYDRLVLQDLFNDLQLVFGSR